MTASFDDWSDQFDALQDEVADLKDIRSRVYDLALAALQSPGYERDFIDHILALTEEVNESDED